MAAYCDSGVFDHLYKKIGCTSADIASLRKKVYGRALSLPLGLHTLEEILLDRRARPEALVARTKLTLSLGNYRRMVKSSDQLLLDDLRAYAAGGAAARPFIDVSLQNIITDGIGELIETDGENLDEDMIAALEAARAERSRFAERLRAALPTMSMSAENFAQFLTACAPAMAENLARAAGVADQCRQRGFAGLLEVRVVKMAVGASLSCKYAELFEQAPPADLADLLHAVAAASVAETFVTDDATLRERLARVPRPDFEVLNLPAFLRTIGREAV